MLTNKRCCQHQFFITDEICFSKLLGPVAVKAKNELAAELGMMNPCRLFPRLGFMSDTEEAAAVLL